jgi:hypothetical protein
VALQLRARYHRWLKRTPEGKKLCELWQKWVADQARKYERDIDADDAANPTIHGLRGTGILLRYSLGGCPPDFCHRAGGNVCLGPP